MSFSRMKIAPYCSNFKNMLEPIAMQNSVLSDISVTINLVRFFSPNYSPTRRIDKLASKTRVKKRSKTYHYLSWFC